jgi:hypothetical protein
MTSEAQALLAALQALEIELRADGDRLRWRPREAVPPDLRQRIVQHKEALVALLARPAPLRGPALSRDSLAGDRLPAVDKGTRPVWILLPNGYPEKVYTPDRIPPTASFWCREGDRRWQPVQGGRQAP